MREQEQRREEPAAAQKDFRGAKHVNRDEIVRIAGEIMLGEDPEKCVHRGGANDSEQYAAEDLERAVDSFERDAGLKYRFEDGADAPLHRMATSFSRFRGRAVRFGAGVGVDAKAVGFRHKPKMEA
jgi:hypothetical protein